MFNVLDLIRLNTEIEQEINAAGELVPRPGKDRVFFAIHRHATGYVTYVGHDLPSTVRRQLLELDCEALLRNHQQVQQILSTYARCDRVFAAHACVFVHVPSPEDYPDALLHQGAYVVMVDGQPVSWAWTQDGSEHAAELAVETLPAYRQRGYGRQVVAAWAAHVLGEGKVAFYSYKLGNTASEALAHSLGVAPYAISVVYS